MIRICGLILLFQLNTFAYAQDEGSGGGAAPETEAPDTNDEGGGSGLIEVDTDVDPGEQAPKIYRPTARRRIKNPSIGGTEALNRFESQSPTNKSLYKQKGRPLDVDTD